MNKVQKFLKRLAWFIFLCGVWTSAVVLGTIYIIAH